jgi:hypothetical protein
VAPDSDGVVERAGGKHGLVRRHFMIWYATRMETQYPIQRKLHANLLADTRAVAFISARRNSRQAAHLWLLPPLVSEPGAETLAIRDECLYFLTIKVHNDGARCDHGRAAQINGGKELRSRARDALRGRSALRKIPTAELLRLFQSRRRPSVSSCSLRWTTLSIGSR